MNTKYLQDDDGRFILLHGITEGGIESEGGWLNPAHEVHRDGSVNAELVGSRCHDGDCDHSDGECGDNGETGEMHFRGEVDNIIEQMTRNYPDSIDQSCGMHIHVSFAGDLLSYAKLMNPKFNRYFLKRVRQWAIDNNINPESRFWKRLAGNNTFAKNIFRPLKQYKSTYKDPTRYSFLNFCHAQHGTLECRLFPMFDMPRIAESAVREFYSIVNQYLFDNAYEKAYTITKDDTG